MNLKLMLTFLILNCLSGFLYSQTEGVITYEITINNHRNIPADQEGRKAMIPQYRTFKQQLFFNANESLYKPLIEEEDDQDQNEGRRFRFRFQGAISYFDQSTSIMLSQMDMRGKKYLITDTLKPAPWKFGTEIKTIQGYECMQAYYTTADERKQTITAWYTMKLRPMLGPEKFNTLPGAVLAIDVNNGERVFVAKKIELRALNKNELVAPNEGQKISQEEFRKMGEEMRRQFNNGGNRGFRQN
jgi:GLPGLI family protein